MQRHERGFTTLPRPRPAPILRRDLAAGGMVLYPLSILQRPGDLVSGHLDPVDLEEPGRDLYVLRHTAPSISIFRGSGASN